MLALAIESMIHGVQWVLALGFTGALGAYGARVLIDLLSDAARP